MRWKMRCVTGKSKSLAVELHVPQRRALRVDELPESWEAFCNRGRYSVGHQRRSVRRCFGPDGIVRGYYSDLPLDPTIPCTRSMYPSHDHTTHPRDDREMVVDARIVNDMKSHLNATEFWLLIEHLYAAGIAKGTIPPGPPRRLPDNWSSLRQFGDEQ